MAKAVSAAVPDLLAGQIKTYQLASASFSYAVDVVAVHDGRVMLGIELAGLQRGNGRHIELAISLVHVENEAADVSAVSAAQKDIAVWQHQWRWGCSQWPCRKSARQCQ